MSKVKEVLDKFFSDYDFNTSMYKKIIKNNIEFISKGDNKSLFSSRLLGNHLVKYTMFDKNIFYNNLFDLSAEEVIAEIDNISTIPKNFKIARDDVNLVCFYIAHRFLSNKELPKEKRLEYATEILNYFTYRTIVLISSLYFIYPISDDKAVSLSERLSNKYIIMKVKNWNEYSIYRSEEYLKSKHLEILISFNKDQDLPNAITDLYNRTKETIKHIYSELIDMLENDEVLKSKSSVVSDIEGKEVIVDKIGSPESYYTKIEQAMTDKQTFIKKGNIDVTVDIINTVSYRQMNETLNLLLDYSYVDREKYTESHKFVKHILVNAIEYLHRNSIYVHSKTNVLLAINSVVGNILYARGGDISVNKLKDEGDKLIKNIYKHYKKPVSNRVICNLRNAVYIYVLLFVLVE